MLPKDYVSVATRVDQFHTDHKEGISIDTTFTLQGDVACFKATVTTKKGTFTWSSFGKLGREKAFEKLETVAVGRALAFAGYETRDGIASKEEMEVFDTNNRATTPITIKKPFITSQNIKNLVREISEGAIVVSSREEALELASRHYVIWEEKKQELFELYSKELL